MVIDTVKYSIFHYKKVKMLMAFFKKIVLTLLLTVAALATTSPAIAEDDISQESVIEALNLAIAKSEEIVSALQSGADAEMLEQLYRDVKYAIKAVVISDSKSAVPRARGNKRMKASRKAFRGGDLDKAVSLASEGVKYYKQTKANKI